MTKYVLAPDSFKESMTANEVCQAMTVGIKQADPQAKIINVPMADGGEGTVDSMVAATHGQKIYQTVIGPLGKKIRTYYGLLGNQSTAVIEMAKASELELVPTEQRNPLLTTTYGTGQLVLDAIKNGADKIIVGLGGSATVDGGAGMAQALGAKLLNQEGKEITFGGGALANLTTIDCSKIKPALKKVQIILASDVKNPLLGPQGAAAVFGPQKGANPQMVRQLEANLKHYSNIIERDCYRKVAKVPGAGAAGGLGAGFLAFTNAVMEKGIDICIQVTKLAQKMKNADYVFTGEGGTDFQTKFGKTPYGVAQVAKKQHIPVISLAGNLGKGIDQLYQEGFTAFFSIVPGPCQLASALKEGPKNVIRTTANIVRLLQKNRARE